MRDRLCRVSVCLHRAHFAYTSDLITVEAGLIHMVYNPVSVVASLTSDQSLGRPRDVPVSRSDAELPSV